MPTAAELVLSYIASLPPHTNVYAALIPFLNEHAATRNPPWMSIVLAIMLIPTAAIFVYAVLIIRCHVKRGDYWLIRVQKNGLLLPDRMLIEAIGGSTYGVIAVFDMSRQLYMDYHKVPVEGKVLSFWLRYPIAYFALWCVMWNCITNHIRGIWNPTFREEEDSSRTSMPKWVVYLLNSIFVLFSVIFLIVYPAIAVPAYLLETEILSRLHRVTNRLRIASNLPNANVLSVSKLIRILHPLQDYSDLTERLGRSIRHSFHFFEVIDIAVTITYIAFVYLTHRQFKQFKKNQSNLQGHQNSDKRLKINYGAELRGLFIEAVVLLVMLSSYQPMYVWAATTRSNHDLVRSTATTLVPELTLGFMACFVGPCVAHYRYTSAKHLLAIKLDGMRPKSTQNRYDLELLDNQSKAGDTQSTLGGNLSRAGSSAGYESVNRTKEKLAVEKLYSEDDDDVDTLAHAV